MREADVGHYECVITNSAGSATERTNLSLKNPTRNVPNDFKTYTKTMKIQSNLYGPQKSVTAKKNDVEIVRNGCLNLSPTTSRKFEIKQKPKKVISNKKPENIVCKTSKPSINCETIKSISKINEVPTVLNKNIRERNSVKFLKESKTHNVNQSKTGEICISGGRPSSHDSKSKDLRTKLCIKKEASNGQCTTQYPKTVIKNDSVKIRKNSIVQNNDKTQQVHSKSNIKLCNSSSAAKQNVTPRLKKFRDLSYDESKKPQFSLKTSLLSTINKAKSVVEKPNRKDTTGVDFTKSRLGLNSLQQIDSPSNTCKPKSVNNGVNLSSGSEQKTKHTSKKPSKIIKRQNAISNGNSKYSTSISSDSTENTSSASNDKNTDASKSSCHNSSESRVSSVSGKDSNLKHSDEYSRLCKLPTENRGSKLAIKVKEDFKSEEPVSVLSQCHKNQIVSKENSDIPKKKPFKIPVIHVEQCFKETDKLQNSKQFEAKENGTNRGCVSHEEKENKIKKKNVNNLSLKKALTEKLRYSTPIIEECDEFGNEIVTEIVDRGEPKEIVLTQVEEKVQDDLERVVPPNLLPVKIVRGPQSVTVLRGESVTLAAHYNGFPPPRVIWIKGCQVLYDSGRHSILIGQDMSVLTVTDVTADDSGKYIVSVENELGGDSRFASMAVVGFPEPPGSEPTASDFTDHSLVLSWYGTTYDGGSAVTGYIVEMCSLPERTWQKVARCRDTSYTVQGLCCGQQYIFRVRAENKYGISHPSSESQVTCLDDYLSEDTLTRDENGISAPLVTVENGSLFPEQYDLKEEVGKGRFGTVFRCIEKLTGRPRAAKVIRCIKLKDKEKVRQEIDIMNRLHHPKLMQILSAFESGRNMIMVMEYISGGELFERVSADDFVLTEQDCVLFMRQICDGVSYMHRRCVLHLDLKPENILCKTRTSHQIKIIDFGLARLYNPDENLRVLFGTPEFVAPEVIAYEPVSPASDMWSVGVICYVMLSGLSPFMGDSDAETFANITRGIMDFEDEAFENISEVAKDFISSLLIKKPRSRLSAEDCLNHPWLAQALLIQNKDNPLSTEKLKRFIIRRKWQKTGTAIRALGRMVSLSRSSMSSSCDSPPILGSPSSSPRSLSWLTRSETADSGDSDVFREVEVQSLPS